MLESKFPELFVFIWVVFSMIARMLVSPAVSQPNIITLVSKQESWCFVFIINEPSIRGIKQAMLQNNRFESIPTLTTLSLYPKHRQDVSILSDYSVSLNRIVVKLTVISELKLGLRVGAFHNNQKSNGQQEIKLHWRLLIIIMPIY